MTIHIRAENAYSDIHSAQCHGINQNRVSITIVNREDFAALPENRKCKKCLKHASKSDNLISPVR